MYNDLKNKIFIFYFIYLFFKFFKNKILFKKQGGGTKLK